MTKTRTLPRRRPHGAKKKPAAKRQPVIIEGETVPDARNANVARSEIDTQRERAFTPGEMGVPDADEEQIPDPANPQGAQGGRGSLAQEGEGNRQNDEMDELNQPVENPRDEEK